MGLYTDTLLERQAKEKRLIAEANLALKDERFTNITSDPLDELQIILSRLFEKYHMKYQIVHGCKTTVELLECVLDTHKIMYEKIDTTDPKWKKSNCQVIAFLESGAPILLSPNLFGYSWVGAYDNKGKRLKKDVKLQKEAFIIFTPLPKNLNNLWSVIKFVFKVMKPISMILIIGCSLLISLLGLIVPIINKWVTGDFIKSVDPNYALFFGMMALFIVRGLLAAVLSAFKKRINDTATIETSSIVEKGLMARILMLPYSYFQNTSSSTLNRYLRSANSLTLKIISILLNTTVTFFFSFVYFPQLFMYGGNTIAGVALIFIFGEFIVSLIISILTAKNDRKVLDALNDSDAAQFATLKGIQKIKGVGAEKRFYSKWAKAYRRYLNNELDPPMAIKLSKVITLIITDGLTLTVLLLAFPNQIDSSNYFAFTSALAFVSTAVNQLSTVIKDFIALNPLVDYLKPVLEIDTDENNQLEYVRNLKGNIRLEHVCFAYEKNGGKLLTDLNLTIKKGEKIAIVGESGCGKSTFVKLLLGLIPVDSGVICYDDYPIQTLNGVSLRKHITSVCQFNKLFPGTIMSNLILANPDLTEEEAWEALKKASIYDDIKALDLGLETEISESISCGFSGGQRQRLLLARAFASKNNILILDEATSALDNQTQDNVLKEVYNLKSTVIMVAHRLSTVINCDRILVFKDGDIVEQGTYKELMKIKDGIFADLMRKQQLKENKE